MVNKKLLALAGLFFLLAVLSHFYRAARPEVKAVKLSKLLGRMEEYREMELESWVDALYCEGDTFCVSGWAFLHDHSTVNTGVIVSVCAENGKDEWAFTAEKSARTDVAAEFGSSLYEGCGYSVVFEMSGLSEGVYRISIVVVDHEQKVFLKQILPYHVQYRQGGCELVGQSLAHLPYRTLKEGSVPI